MGGGGAEDIPLAHLIAVNAVTQDGPQGPCLSATWSWADSVLSEPEVRELADLYAGRMRRAALGLLRRHPNLAVVIHRDGLEKPVQVITLTTKPNMYTQV